MSIYRSLKGTLLGLAHNEHFKKLVIIVIDCSIFKINIYNIVKA